MLLPTKNQIQEHKSKERQVEIDQGLSFARKVDALRETKEKEEIELAKFRKEASESLKKDINALLFQKDSLAKEVSVLEERKTKSLEPINRELRELEEKRLKIEKTESAISEKLLLIEAKRIYIDKKLLEVESLTLATETKLQSVSIIQKEASDYKAETLSILKKMENKDRILNENIEAFEKKSKQILESVAIRERNVENKLRNNQEKEKSLNDKERSINDKYETLLRTQKRLHG